MERLKELFDVQKILGFLVEYWYFILIFIMVIVTIIVLIVVLTKRGKNKKKEKIIVDILDAKEYIVIKSKKNKHISFIVENNASDKRFDYLISNEIVCGRADFCDIVFNDSKMSRYHFCIQKQNKKYIITDMNSTNGTYLNGIKLNEFKELKNRDRIFAGNTTITVIFQE